MADTAADAPDTSLRDSISAAMDAPSPAAELSPVTADVPAPEAASSGPSAGDGPARGADGKFVAKAPDAAGSPPSAAVPAEGVAAPVPPAADPLAAPQHWKAEDKAAFEKLPPEARSLMLEQDKRRDAAHTRRTQELGDIARLAPVFEPIKADMQASGHTPESLTRFLLGELQGIRRDPVAKIKELMGAYGVDLAKLGGAPAASPAAGVDPATLAPGGDPMLEVVKPLQEKLDALESRYAAETHQKAMSAIDQFASEKTGTGEPAHPHIEEVMSDMIDLARFEQSKGRQPALKELYDRAVWLNPSTREKLQAASGAAAQITTEQAAAAKAAQARQAASSVRGGPGSGSAPAPDRSLREEIAAQMPR